MVSANHFSLGAADISKATLLERPRRVWIAYVIKLTYC